MTIPKRKTKRPNRYTYSRDRDGVDDTFVIYHPNGEQMVAIRHWGGQEEAFAEFRAKLIVKTLNAGYWWDPNDAAYPDPETRTDRRPGAESPRPSDRLPPSPDGKNDLRAAWAASAVRTFQDATGTDDEDALCDLLCDLMHWADRHRQDFEAALERGRDHYQVETGVPS
jgi:hypothetical protein